MERRLHDRTETNVLMRCRVPAQPCRAVMRDVSHDGCGLHFADAVVQQGGSVSLEVPGCRPIPGSITWVHGLSAGLRFDNPLCSAAAISLGLEDPQPEPELIPEPEPYPEQVGLLRHWLRRFIKLRS
jgi:hypothetical protein